MKKKIAFLSSYNQCCGLATYLSYLTRHLNEEDFIVLAEDVPLSQRIRSDEPNVHRSWNQLSDDYSRIDAQLEKEDIGVLHLNCQFVFFNMKTFAPLLSKWRGRGLKVIAHIHNPSSYDLRLQQLIAAVDQIIVHLPENTLDVMANGAREDQVYVLEHGVEEINSSDFFSARKQLQIPNEQRVVVVFGFVEPHKKIDEVLLAIKTLRDNQQDLHLYVVGGPHPGNKESFLYLQSLKDFVTANHLTDRVHFREGFISEEEVTFYLHAADTVFVGHSSEEYEASGSLCLALGCGAAVITSAVPRFARFRDVVFRVTKNFPLPLALLLVISNKQLNSTLRKNARLWAKTYSWKNQLQKILTLYQSLSGLIFQGQNHTRALSEPLSKNQTIQPTYRIQRILFRDCTTPSGTQTSHAQSLQQIAALLRQCGVVVEFSNNENLPLALYDLVHIFESNVPISTSKDTERYGKRALAEGVPFVITSLQREPSFSSEPYSTPPQTNWPLIHADALIASSKEEQRLLSQALPETMRSKVVCCEGMNSLQTWDGVRSSPSNDINTKLYQIYEEVLARRLTKKPLEAAHSLHSAQTSPKVPSTNGPQEKSDNFGSSPLCIFIHTNTDTNVSSLKYTLSGLGWRSEHLLVPVDGQKSSLEAISQQIRTKQPEVVYCSNLEVLPEEFLRSIRPHLKLLVGEVSKNNPPCSHLFDLIISSDPTFSESLKRSGHAVYSLPDVFEIDPLKEIESRSFAARTIELSFIGSLASRKRDTTSYLESIGRKFPLQTWNPPPHQRALREVLKNSRMTLLFDSGDEPSDRRDALEVIGCGTLLLAHENCTLPAFLEEGKEVITFQNLAQCEERIYYYLCHPKEAETIAQAGRARFLSHYTEQARTEQLITILTEHLAQPRQGHTLPFHETSSSL